MPDWELLLRFLPAGWEAQAKHLRAFERGRKIGTPADLLRLVLVACGLGLSYQDTAGALCLAGLEPMSKVAVFKRLRKARAWLEWLVATMLGARVTVGPPVGLRLVAVDGSTVAGPRGKVQLRLHYGLELMTLRPVEVVVTPNTEAEGLQRFHFQAGDVAVADRYYAKAQGLGEATTQGALVLVRLGCTSLTLYDQGGKKLDLLSWLRKLEGYQPGECPARFRGAGGQWVEGRVCAVRLSPEAAEKARQRLRGKGRRPRAATLERAGYMTVFTTVPAAAMEAATVLEWYAVRWQVELAFKRLKSLLEVDQLRDLTPEMAAVWLLGKMLYALLLHAYLDEAGAFSPWGYPLRGGRGDPGGGPGRDHAAADGVQGLGLDGVGQEGCRPSHPSGRAEAPRGLATRPPGAGWRALSIRPAAAARATRAAVGEGALCIS